jgi:hypothetical protein
MTFTYSPRPTEAWAARAGKKFDGQISPTVARKFVLDLQGAPTVETQPAPAVAAAGFVETRRSYLRCITCGHWRAQHCTKRKLKPGQAPSNANWKGFVDDDGQVQPCSHTVPDAKPYNCDSNACAVVVGEDYCPCKKFVSPFAKKKAAKSRTPKITDFKSGGLIPREDLIAAHRRYLAEQAAQAGPKIDKVKVLLEVVREDPNLTVAVLADASGMSQAWVRRHLRAAGLLAPAKPRKSTAFATGREPLPGVEAPRWT